MDGSACYSTYSFVLSRHPSATRCKSRSLWSGVATWLTLTTTTVGCQCLSGPSATSHFTTPLALLAIPLRKRRRRTDRDCLDSRPLMGDYDDDDD